MIQSNYIPWRGYFDFIDDVDLFIFYDDVQYGRGKKWINRNAIKTRTASRWMTVPLQHHPSDALIREVRIDYSRNWQRDHLNLLYENYRRAPFWENYIGEFARLINQRYASISELNIALARWVMECLKIETKVTTADKYLATGGKRERPLALLLELGATAYLSGPRAEPYTPSDLFASRGIGLSFKTYEYEEYKQLWRDFIGNVTVLDLLFNAGQDARAYLKSKAPNRLVIDPGAIQ